MIMSLFLNQFNTILFKSDCLCISKLKH